MYKRTLSLALVVTMIVLGVSLPKPLLAIGPSSANSITQAALQCDTPQAYYGVQHCVDSATQAQVIVVDLNDPHVRLQTVLSNGPSGECNSVNGNDRDIHSNCPYPYPLEPLINRSDALKSMLGRYQSSGAVAIINTDYFGCGTPQFPCGGSVADHGAQGLAVKNGTRLDGPVLHNDTDGNELTKTSLAFSAAKVAIIGKPTSESQINTNGAYYNVIAGGPQIVTAGQAAQSNNVCLNDGLPPASNCVPVGQSAAGLTSNGHLVLVTANTDAVGIANYLTSLPAPNVVRDALKFDGGGSAHLAWIDSSGQIQDYAPSGTNRPVAEALVIFSTRISRNTSTVTDVPNPDTYSCSQPGYIGFEGFPDKTNLSSGTVAGMHFTTTNGYTWLVGDFAAGSYNGKYPNGAYTSHGTHWAWLGETQGAGRIDFPKGSASYFSLLVSDSSPVFVDAYSASGSLLVTAGPAPSNVNTGHLTELRITRASADVAYVIVHDNGNYFEIDDVCTDSPGTPNTINTVVDQTYFMQTGQHIFGSFIINLVTGAHQFLHFFLGPFNSDVDLVLTRPNGTVVSPSDSDILYNKTANSVEVSIDVAPAGQWSYEIIANQLETGGENIHAVGEEETIINSYSFIYLPLIGNSTSPFVGNWSNQDPNTLINPKATIGLDGNSFFVHMWGACVPDYCDWGEASTNVSDASDGTLSFTWTFDFATETQNISLLPDGRLEVVGHVHFTDSSGRQDYDYTEYFSRAP